SGKEIAVLNGEAGRAEFSPDGQFVLTTSSDNTARAWNAATGEEAALRGHTDKVNSARFSADGTRIVTASSDFTVRIADGGQVPIVLKGHTNRVHGAVFSPDGQWIATASEDGKARLWNGGAREGSVRLEGMGHGMPGRVIGGADGDVVLA